MEPTGDPEPTTGRTSTSTAGPATTSSSPSTTTTSPSTTTSALPGGTGPTVALAEAGYLRGGRIVLDALREAATAQDDDTDTAGQPATDLCHYLFGTAEEVAALTRLSGAIHLAPPSGPHLTTDTYQQAGEAVNALIIACVYADDSGAQVVLQVSEGPPVDADLPGQPIIVTGDSAPEDTTGSEVQAVISYRPDRTGPRIDRSTARDWLTAALGRVTAGG